MIASFPRSTSRGKCHEGGARRNSLPPGKRKARICGPFLCRSSARSSALTLQPGARREGSARRQGRSPRLRTTARTVAGYQRRPVGGRDPVRVEPGRDRAVAESVPELAADSVSNPEVELPRTAGTKTWAIGEGACHLHTHS
jgi:hypothetical protein